MEHEGTKCRFILSHPCPSNDTTSLVPAVDGTGFLIHAVSISVARGEFPFSFAPQWICHHRSSLLFPRHFSCRTYVWHIIANRVCHPAAYAAPAILVNVARTSISRRRNPRSNSTLIRPKWKKSATWGRRNVDVMIGWCNTSLLSLASRFAGIPSFHDANGDRYTAVVNFIARRLYMAVSCRLITM